MAEPDEAVWRQRFLLFMVVRFVGIAIFLLGVAVAYFDVLRPGGWPQVGAIVAIAGAIDALVAPHLLRKRWRQEDEARK